MRKALLLVCASMLLASTTSPVCPEDMVVARPGVCIDRYEWPNKKGVKPRLAQSATDYSTGPGPINSAEDFCAYYGKRTCSRKEWVAACLGPEGAKLPYGNAHQPGKCNVDKQWRSVNPVKVEQRSAKELARLDQSEPAGSREECVSASGASDMVGNAEEWVRCDKGQEDVMGFSRWCLVGGYWSDTRSSCTYVVTKHVPEWHYYQTGFRCCKDMK